MATAARHLEDLDAPRPRLRLVEEPDQNAPLMSVRTCTRCGERTSFVRDDDAGWYACSACGQYG